MTIECITEHDIEDVVAVLRTCWKQEPDINKLQPLLSENLSYASYIGKEMVGVCINYITSTNKFTLKHICVKPEYIGQGIGTELVLQTIREYNRLNKKKPLSFETHHPKSKGYRSFFKFEKYTAMRNFFKRFFHKQAYNKFDIFYRLDEDKINDIFYHLDKDKINNYIKPIF